MALNVPVKTKKKCRKRVVTKEYRCDASRAVAADSQVTVKDFPHLAGEWIQPENCEFQIIFLVLNSNWLEASKWTRDVQMRRSVNK